MKISFFIHFFNEKEDLANNCREIKNLNKRFINWLILKNRFKSIYKERFYPIIYERT